MSPSLSSCPGSNHVLQLEPSWYRQRQPLAKSFVFSMATPLKSYTQHLKRIRLSGIDCPEKGHAYGQRAK